MCRIHISFILSNISKEFQFLYFVWDFFCFVGRRHSALPIRFSVDVHDTNIQHAAITKHRNINNTVIFGTRAVECVCMRSVPNGWNCAARAVSLCQPCGANDGGGERKMCVFICGTRSNAGWSVQCSELGASFWACVRVTQCCGRSRRRRRCCWHIVVIGARRFHRKLLICQHTQTATYTRVDSSADIFREYTQKTHAQMKANTLTSRSLRVCVSVVAGRQVN